MQLIKDNLKVEWVDIGEGWDGYYNPDDPSDEPLLRFDCYELVNGEWQDIEDSSYCTRMPVGTDEMTLQAGLAHIMNELVATVSAGYSAKKLCEGLSWISPDWFKEDN